MRLWRIYVYLVHQLFGNMNCMYVQHLSVCVFVGQGKMNNVSTVLLHSTNGRMFDLRDIANWEMAGAGVGFRDGVMIPLPPSLSVCLIPYSCTSQAVLSHPLSPLHCSILHDHIWNRCSADLGAALSGVHYSYSLLHLQWVLHHWLECPRCAVCRVIPNSSQVYTIRGNDGVLILSNKGTLMHGPV